MKRVICIGGVLALSVAFLAMGIGLLHISSMPRAAAAPNAVQLAVAHLAPFAPNPNTAVTVTVNGLPVLTDISYGETSKGYAVLPIGGSYVVHLIPAGSPTPVLTKTIVVTDGNAYTAVAVGGAYGHDLDILLLEDQTTIPVGLASVRIGHLAPFASVITDTLADVCLQDGTVILDNVPFGTVGGYLPLLAGRVDLKIMNADNTATLIDLYPVTLSPGDLLSVFATGDGVNQPLGVFAMFNSPADGFLPLAAALQVAHLAPFGPTPMTAVTVTLQGTPVLTNVVYGVSTGYMPILAGVDQEVGILPAGASDPALTATLNLTQAKGFAAVAYGGANTWNLGLMLLEDDAIPPFPTTAKVRIGHLAPFSYTLIGTLADIRTQTGLLAHPALDDVPYGAVTSFLPLPAALYDLKITDGGNTVTLIDLFPIAINDGDTLSVFAVGDGTNQPLGVYALPLGQPGFMLPLARYTYLPHIVKNAGP